MVRGPVPSSRSLRWLTNIVALLAVVAFALVVWTLVNLRGQVDEQQRDLHQADTARRELADSVAKQADALAKANRRLIDAGKTPVPTPPAPAPSTIAGPQGVAGPQGPAGPAGPVGPQGPEGLMGLLGLTGPRGPVGATGDPGAPGSAGAAGADGKDGATGPAGPAGPAGPKGEAGAKGDTGPVGPAGPRGLAQPGTYACPDGQYVTGLTIADDGTVTLACAGLLPPGQSQSGGQP